MGAQELERVKGAGQELRKARPAHYRPEVLAEDEAQSPLPNKNKKKGKGGRGKKKECTDPTYYINRLSRKKYVRLVRD